MTWKVVFIAVFIWSMLRLVQRERLALDLASFTLLLIVMVMAVSFSPYLVERIATILEFGTPSMSVVALVIAGLLIVCVVLAVMVSDHKRQQARLIRQLARIELRWPKQL